MSGEPNETTRGHPRGLIEAMGGGLEIVARFPDQPDVKIVQFEALDANEPSKR